MSWINENRNFIRAVAWLLSLLALLGPWAFDLIHVPAEYTCDKPFIRLEGDFCGYPMSGFQLLMYYGIGFFHILAQLIMGTFSGRGRELFMVLFLLPLIPLFSTPILIIRKISHRLQTINLVAWGAAAALSLTIAVFQIKGQALQLWGLALYTALAVIVFIVEVLVRMQTADQP